MSKIRNVVRKVSTQLSVWNLSPEQMVAFQRGVHAQAIGSAHYQAAPMVQNADARWQQVTDALEAYNTLVKNAEAALEAARVTRAQSVVNYKIAAASYSHAVEDVSQSDASLVSSLGLSVRNNPGPATAVETPTNVALVLSKSSGFPRLSWHISARGTCVVQATTDVTGETGWSQVAVVTGQSLRLNPAPTTTLYRVARIFRGSPGPWSTTAMYQKR